MELAKLVKQSGEDAITLALVREDAEQSESEAALARSIHFIVEYFILCTLNLHVFYKP